MNLNPIVNSEKNNEIKINFNFIMEEEESEGFACGVCDDENGNPKTPSKEEEEEDLGKKAQLELENRLYEIS